MKKKWLSLWLAVCMLVTLMPVASIAASDKAGSVPSVDNISSIQAFSDLAFYGQKLTRVEVKYNGNVDLSGVTKDTYTLLDRGYSNPDFAEVTIDSVEIKGKTVTLNIHVDTEALENNNYIYIGEDATGPRAKNPVGLYATGPWYRDVNGIIYFGSDNADDYENNTTGKGYQTRESLELKLFHEGEDEALAACLANEDGSYNENGLWRPTIDANYGKNGFQTFEELGIQVPTTATDGEDYVRGWAYFPKGYSKNSAKDYPLIITITGAGTSFWRLPDGTNNFGTGLNFDGSGFRWMDSGAIVLNIHDRSMGGGDDYKFWVDDYNVIQYFIEHFNADPDAITLSGNSRGTVAVNTIASEYPGLIDKLVLNNGWLGSGIAGKGMFDGVWGDEEWANAAKNGLSIWAFDGELDTNNIEYYQTAITQYKAAGWSDEWISKNIRLTGFPTKLYYYWGETDHSTTKMTYWYFFDNLYYGPDAEIVDGELVYNSKLDVGDSYQLKGRLVGGEYIKEDFDYKIYGETLKDWVLSEDEKIKKGEAMSLNDLPFPDYDYSQANQLPMTGYFEYDLNIEGVDRTAKIYISENAPIRSYFTVIAVPDGVETGDFLDKTGWKAIADETAEGLFILEPGADGWGSYSEEAAYISAALRFFSSNKYFSIFGEHYFVGYGNGAPALEAWAAANPLKVISQVYLDSEGLDAAYFTPFETMTYGGTNGNYNPIVFPDGFEYITVSEALLPTWYINPSKEQIDDSLNYWLSANDCDADPVMDQVFGEVFAQSEDSESWMTSHSGPISKVAVLDKKVSYWNKKVTEDICEFMTFYSRYENAVAYGNQLVERADYDALGIEIRTMMVEGEIREYMIYVPDSAEATWGDKAPVVMVWPGNTQTDKVFLDATQWWKVAQDEGFVLAIVCEQYVANSVTVSHKNSITFYEQLKEVLLNEYDVDPSRIYSTGQSAGSMVSQSFAAAFPEFFAAVASTSGDARFNADGDVVIENVPYEVSGQMIPNYLIYGTGDLGFLKGHLWDDIDNNLDALAAYHLAVNGFSLDDHSYDSASLSGWMDRFKTWTWSENFGDEEVPLFQVTENIYRSHNCIHEEMPVLWDFLEHYGMTADENGDVERFYSPSGFKVPGDEILIYSSK